jgi:hypothetical protein
MLVNRFWALFLGDKARYKSMTYNGLTAYFSATLISAVDLITVATLGAGVLCQTATRSAA